MKARHCFALGFLILLVASDLRAQVRTFVSTSGADNAICSRTAPCRTFGAAMAAVAAGGEVVALDSGGYGPFTVDKSVTVLAPGAIHAAIAPTAGNAIVVNALSSDIVVLRGLYLNSQGAQDAIDFTNAAELHVENVVAANFNGSGVYAHTAAKLFIIDSIFRFNNYGLFLLNGGSGTLRGSIDRVRVESSQATFSNPNPAGIHVGAGGVVNISNSLVSGGAWDGVLATDDALVNVDTCVVTLNAQSAFTARETSRILVANSLATHNAQLVFTDDMSEVNSYGDNRTGGETGFTNLIATE